METELKQFSIKDINLFKNDEDVDFALGEVWLLAEGNNSHKNPVDIEILKRDAHTMLGKFLVAEYSKWDKDVTTHTNQQQIIGYFPKDGKIEFREKDGKIFAVYEVLISKLYATPVYMLFKEHNFRNVSAEFSAVEGDEDEQGNKPILGIMFHGCTILGLDYQPSCEGAEMSVKRFSTDADNYYKNKAKTTLERFSEERRLKMAVTYKVNKTELKDTAWGDVDKTSLRNKIMDASNKASLVKDVYALVENGWEDAPSEHLKYPLMQLVGDTFYYNRGALSSALAYAKQENVQSVINKVESLYKKFNLDENKKEKEMSEKKFDELEGREVYAEVERIVKSKLGDHFFVDDIEDDKVVVTDEQTKVRYDIPAKIEVGEDDKSIKADIDFDKKKESEDQKEMEKQEEAFAKGKAKDGDKQNGKEVAGDKKEMEAEDKKKMAETQKEMSLDTNAYAGAILEMLKAETAEQRAEAKKLCEPYGECDESIVMEQIEEMCNQMSELRAFKEKVLSERKDAEVKRVLAQVKQDMDAEAYKELEEKSQDVTFENVEQFKKEAKAFAFDNPAKNKKTKKNDDVIRMGYDFMQFAHKDDSANVFEKINNK